MSERVEVLEIVRQWTIKAEHDLKTAEHTLTLEEECPYDTVCFHAQQCVEKYFKALLTLHSIEFSKTHDLTELVVLLPADIRQEITQADIEDLNPYAVETRYPGDWEPLTREDAIRAVTVARSIRQMIRQHLPPNCLTES